MPVSVPQFLPPCQESQDFQAGSVSYRRVSMLPCRPFSSPENTQSLSVSSSSLWPRLMLMLPLLVIPQTAITLSSCSRSYPRTSTFSRQGVKSGILSRFQLFSCHKLKPLMCFLHRSQESELYRFIRIMLIKHMMWFDNMGRKSSIHHLKRRDAK